MEEIFYFTDEDGCKIDPEIFTSYVRQYKMDVRFCLKIEPMEIVYAPLGIFVFKNNSVSILFLNYKQILFFFYKQIMKQKFWMNSKYLKMFLQVYVINSTDNEQKSKKETPSKKTIVPLIQFETKNYKGPNSDNDFITNEETTFQDIDSEAVVIDYSSEPGPSNFNKKNVEQELINVISIKVI